MTTFLRTPEMKEYVEDLDEAVIGYQYHTNHRDCSAGADSKRRLYIKRGPDGWMFYCHHCNAKGYLRTADKMYRAPRTLLPSDVLPHSPMTTVVQGLCEDKYEGDLNKWPVEARIWWLSYGLDETDAKHHNVQWVDETQRLFMPCGGTWVGRGFDRDGAKYLHYKVSDAGEFVSLPYGDHRMVIVEDTVSAFKVHKAGLNALALLGTTANARDIHLVSYYKSVYIWLDPDTAGQMGAVKVYKQLSGMVDMVCNINAAQPKECSLEEIRRLCRA